MHPGAANGTRERLPGLVRLSSPAYARMEVHIYGTQHEAARSLLQHTLPAVLGQGGTQPLPELSGIRLSIGHWKGYRVDFKCLLI